MSQNGQPQQAKNLTTDTRKSDRKLVVTRTFDSPARPVQFNGELTAGDVLVVRPQA